MRISKLNESIEILKEGLGRSLVVADCIGIQDGMSIVRYSAVGEQTHAAPLICSMTAYINNTLKQVGVNGLGKYYMLDIDGRPLAQDFMKLVLVPLHEYQWAIIVTSQVQLGMLLHVIVPKLIDKFEEALVE